MTGAPSTDTAVTDTAAVRPGEALNLEALRSVLRPLLGDAPLMAEQFPGGHSNLTYLLRSGEQEFVLRRAPVGPVAPRAHDMVREFRFLSLMHPAFPEAPRPVWLCEDAAVLGVPFFLMERRRGVIIRTKLPTEYTDIPDAPRRASEALVDTLARLHSVDIHAAGLDQLGKPEGFNRRQVEGWAARWQRAETHPNPESEGVVRWLLGEVPNESAHTAVHNDFKLDNLMLGAADPGQVVALLDWEMSAVGDPLVDLGLSLAYWTQRGFPAGHRYRTLIGEPGAALGFYTRAELLERYAARTGRNLPDLRWYEVLGVFKLAVILQQIYARYHAGQTQDERFAALGAQAQALIAEAARQIGE